MRAVVAILVDAYRELASRKIFWITLLLSLVLVVGYASIGFTETGMSMLYGLYSIENEYFNADSALSPVLYKGIFVTFIVGMWLAWAAAILALISTASIFPDLVARGSIDLILSKPVSRATVFGAKYCAGLLFATLQVAIVCIGVFIALGWRLGEWDWKIFLALPVVVVFFSYLFSVSALVGVVSRSSITALLLAMLFWFMLFSVQSAEAILHQVKLEQVTQVERMETAAAETRERLEALDDEEPTVARARLEQQLEEAEELAAERRRTIEPFERWHSRIEMLLLPLPKTGQTIGLLERWLVRDSDLTIQDLFTGQFRFDDDGEVVPIRQPETEAQRRLQDAYLSKSLWHVIGTSLLFEFVVLLLACWIFVRRDF